MRETTGPAAECGLFLAVFAFYCAGAYPCFASRDSADMAAAALSLGVAHPPGYPLYAALGRLWIELVPLGNPAYRLNLLSAAAGSLAVVALWRLLREESGLLGAWTGAGAWACSAPMWKFSGLEEMYSLHALFAVGLLGLGRGSAGTVLRRARLSALAAGLGLVNHQSLLLALPALGLLWRAELARHRIEWRTAAAAALPMAGLGLGLYLAVWARLGDAGLAWRVVTRADYGTLVLSSQFSAPLTAASAGALLGHFGAALARGVSWPAAGLAALGAWELARRRPALGAPLFWLFLLCGPAYFLLTRFDVSGWLARSVLETAFVLPAMALCAAAAFGAQALAARGRGARLLPPLLAGLGVWAHLAEGHHRGDFGAYDYVRSLRRMIPAGASVLAAGDTVQFGWRYLDLAEPRGGAGRELRSALEEGNRGWVAERLRRGPVYVVGLSRTQLGELGLLDGAPRLAPSSLAFEVKERPVRGGGDDLWELCAVREEGADPRRESYARDVSFAQALARYQAAEIGEALGAHPRTVALHYLQAARLDPESFRLELVPDNG